MSDIDRTFERVFEELRADRTAVRTEMAAVRNEMAAVRAEMTAFRADVRSDFADVGSNFGEVRSDLGDLRGEILALHRHLNGIVVKFSVAIVGLFGATIVASVFRDGF